MFSCTQIIGSDRKESPFPSIANIGEIVEIQGKVVRIAKDQTLTVKQDYSCQSCKAVAFGYANYSHFFTMVPPRCPNRYSKACRGFMRVNSKYPEADGYLKYQEVLIREANSSVAIPRVFTATLEGDQTDSIYPGDLIAITGSVERRTSHISNPKQQTTSLALRCQTITSIDGKKLIPDVEAEIRKARKKWLNLAKEHGELVARDFLIRSSFPNVKGLDYPKLALLLLLTGTPERIESNPRDKGVRNQSHILLVGDPGTAKSRLLQYVADYTKPSVYTNGLGCTAAGLTAACIRTGSQWNLEAGALVLCDGGVCCIDEWNLLKPVDQASVHEAMEQQMISMAKAGIVRKLSCRCSIVAATNPKTDPGDDELTSKHMGFSTSLISRFDLILVIRDQKDDSWDVEMTDFLLKINRSQEKILFDEDEVKAHILFAKSKKPKFSPAAFEILGAYFGFCRSDEFRDLSRTTVRLQESLMRLAVSHARLLGRDEVTQIDAVTAVILMESSMGFGRLITPMNLIKAAIPLEPSRVTIMTILKRLKSESKLSYNEYNWVPEEEVVESEVDEDDQFEEEMPDIPEKVMKMCDDNISAEEKEISIADDDEDSKEHLSQMSLHSFIRRMEENDSTYGNVSLMEDKLKEADEFEQTTQKEELSKPDSPAMECDSPIIFRSQEGDRPKKLIVVEDLLDDEFDDNLLTQVLSQTEAAKQKPIVPSISTAKTGQNPIPAPITTSEDLPGPSTMDDSFNFLDGDDFLQEIVFKKK